ncbi:hypothetical protein HYV82_03940 [Candidatus Woesearchaeota archaeon]|nr:hypothetical protein [Candidatus Woesearchaeota archaeon]
MVATLMQPDPLTVLLNRTMLRILCIKSAAGIGTSRKTLGCEPLPDKHCRKDTHGCNRR